MNRASLVLISLIMVILIFTGCSPSVQSSIISSLPTGTISPTSSSNVPKTPTSTKLIPDIPALTKTSTPEQVALIDWTSANNGLFGGAVRALAISPGYASDHTIFAGTYSDVFRSTDGGATWKSVSQGILPAGNNNMMGINIMALAISPDFVKDHTIFACVGGGGIVKSVDGGSTWRMMNEGFKYPTIQSLAISPTYAIDHTLFAGASMEGIYRSVDGGNSWQLAAKDITTLDVYTCFAISPAYASDHTVYVGTGLDGVFRSVDSGATWQPTQDLSTNVGTVQGIGAPSVNTLAISPAYPVDHTIFAGTLSGMFRSVDSGANWQEINQGLFDLSVASLTWLPTIFAAVSPAYANDHTVFAATYCGAFISSDGGSTWQQTNQNLTSATLSCLAISPNYANDRNIFAGSAGGIFLSANSGATWRAVNQGLTAVTVASLVVSPNYAEDHTLFAGTSGTGVFRSVDRGSSWQSANQGLTTSVLQSGQIPDLSSVEVNLAISPAYATDHTIFAGISGGGVFRSTDSGSTWRSVSTGLATTLAGIPIPDLGVSVIAISPSYATDHTLYAGTSQIYRSIDSGETWQVAHQGLPDLLAQTIVTAIVLSPNYNTDGTLFVGLGVTHGIYRSVDRTDTWQQINEGLPERPLPSTLAISPNFARDHTIFAGLAQGSYRSVDGGSTWKLENQGLAYVIQSYAIPIGVDSISISVTFESDHTIYAGGSISGGIFRSIDSGSTWEGVYLGLPGFDGYAFITAIALSPAYTTDKTVFVGITGKGIFRGIVKP
jgi:photosystem II stability/assembly factor-like uncharacterized protein